MYEKTENYETNARTVLTKFTPFWQ